jgi:transcriptional regulator with XRE-family HTH domain
MATLSSIIKDKIATGGFSKAYIASELGVGERTIEYYMTGERKPDLDNLIKLSSMLGFQLNELTEQEVRKDKPSSKQRKTNGGVDNSYVSLLESNDRFFKNEYAQLLISLNKLIDLSKKQEALLKLNLQHVGAVEALQKGVEPEVVQEQINIQIADMGPSEEMDNDADSQDRP